MKKSEVYKMAEVAVVNSLSISAQDKIEILRELIEQEDLALYREEREVE